MEQSKKFGVMISKLHILDILTNRRPKFITETQHIGRWVGALCFVNYLSQIDMMHGTKDYLLMMFYSIRTALCLPLYHRTNDR